MSEAGTTSADNAGVAVRPPVLILGALLAAAVLELIWPLGPGLALGRPLPVMIGLGLAVFGAALFAHAHRQFARAGNAASPRKPTAALVTDGLYALTRNPVYMALLLVYFGLCTALTTLWGMILLPAVAIAFDRLVAPAEERYLERAFGDAYRAYAARVPRWF